MITKNCQHCEKEFNLRPCLINKRKFCSHKCYWESLKGHAAWNKGVAGLIGKANPRYTMVDKECKECGSLFSVKNYRKETANFCSHGCASQFRDEGKTSLFKKIRKSFKYKQWRKSVFERDNYTCQDCGRRGGELNADHIKPFALFPELRFDLDNGRTLCIDCHKKTGTWGRCNIFRNPNGCVAVANET